MKTEGTVQTMKSTFLYQDTQLPAYLQFPEFLLRLPIMMAEDIGVSKYVSWQDY